MDWHADGKSRNVLQIDICPTKMATYPDKKYKTVKIKEIISAVCALFNSGGGKLKLLLNSYVPKRYVDDCVRMTEQRLTEMVGITTMVWHTKFEVNPREIILYIRETKKLISLNYNLYLPSERQVIAVPATTPSEKIKEIIQRKIVGEKTVLSRSHLIRHVKGQNSGLHEGTNVQIKNLKANSSKCTTLADRITGKSNKLVSYISAFGNHCGGNIYYGINKEGIVDGEEITEQEKEEIIKKVAKSINKMVWPQHCGQPQRGKQWDIFFEPVEDISGKPIPSTFVIVISVPPCLGGVFTEEPESYYIAESKVKKASFLDWWRNFTGISEHLEFLSVPSHVSRVQWSSDKNRKICLKLSEKLVQHRNDGDMKAFNKLSELAMVHFPESDVHLIVKAEEVVVAYKHYNFHKAESLLNEFASLLKHSKDCSIFEIRKLLLQSMIEHSKGNCETSYEIAQHGLHMMQDIPVDLTTVWFYIEAATVTTTILTTAHGFKRYELLKDSGRQYLQLAVRDANSLDDRPDRMMDLRQKLHIYKAWTHLECSVTGQVAQENRNILSEDIEVAAEELVSVAESVFRGSPLTHFRSIQYHLAQCDLLRRRSEINQEDYISNLKQAFEYGSKARVLARKHRFENMVDYASKRLAYLAEKLVRHAVSTLLRPTRKNFLGLEY